MRDFFDDGPLRLFCGITLAIFLVGFVVPPFGFGDVLVDRLKFALAKDVHARGIPQYRSELEFKQSDGQSPAISFETKVALVRFPTTGSCLSDEDGGPGSEALSNIDWNRITSAAEAEVCIFRVLSTLGDISHAVAWLAAEGFEPIDRKPRTEPGGLRSVSGRWSIRRNGERYQRGILIMRLLPTFAHSITVRTYWSAAGNELLYVTQTFNYGK